MSDHWFRGLNLEDLVVVSFSRGSGPGGQHVNKTSTRVEVRLVVDLLEQLDAVSGSKVRARHGDVLVVRCGQTRSQWRNRKLAMEQLQAILEESLMVTKERKETKPPAVVDARRRAEKVRRSRRLAERHVEF